MKNSNKFIHILGLIPTTVTIISIILLLNNIYEFLTVFMVLTAVAFIATIFSLFRLEKSKTRLFYIVFNILLLLLIIILNIILNSRNCIGCNTPPKSGINCPECNTCTEDICYCKYKDENGNDKTIKCPDKEEK